MSTPRFLPALFLLAITLLLAGPARAELIPRTIVINGSFTDWIGSGGSYDPPGDLLANPNQFSTDCQSATACELDGSLSAAGRDLRSFAFTWDDNNLYFYLQRWQNATNVTDWWFYMDTNGNQLMNSGEKVMRVRWSGSNRLTTVSIWNYNPASPAGDPLIGPPAGTADGYTMPGTVSGEAAIYSTTGGGSTGLEMEARLPWSALGSSGPTNMGFHIASSNGTNLPNSIIDNMNGPGLNQLFPSDIQVEKSASVSSVTSNTTFTYTVLARNLGYSPITAVAISDVLPADVTFVSALASNGSYDDSDSNGIPDRWNLASLGSQENASLVITVRAANVTAPVVTTNTATLVAWTGINSFTTNDSASASVTLNPGPLLTTVKTASAATVTSGQTLRYRVYISNVGYSVATSVIAIDALSPFTTFRLDTFAAGQHVRFTQGTPSSLLSLGTVQYSADGGGSWTYVPVSGGGGAAMGYDGAVTHVRLPLTGIMAGAGSNFWLEYDVMVR